MKHYLIILCLFTSAAIAGPFVIIGQETLTINTPSLSQEELVHFGDVIDIDVVGGFEFDWRGRINPEGFIDGLEGATEPVYALCRTELQIAADVAKVFGKILRDPKIVVKIIDRSNRAVVRLEGAVKTPTRFRLDRKVRLRELLVLAGGLIDGASGEITIFRPRNLSCGAPSLPVPKNGGDLLPQDNGSQTINIKISEILTGKTEADPQILSGDMITVMRSAPVYVIGAVNNPKPIYSANQITVSRAVAIAGGLAKDADGGKVSIFRRENGETKTISVELGKIKRSESDDAVLKPFDIIDVAVKGGGKRKYPPVAAVNEVTDRGPAELPLRVVD